MIRLCGCNKKSAIPIRDADFLEENQKDDQCQYDSVNGEGYELNFVDEFQEETDRDECENKCRDKACDEKRQGIQRDVLPILK